MSAISLLIVSSLSFVAAFSPASRILGELAVILNRHSWRRNCVDSCESWLQHGYRHRMVVLINCLPIPVRDLNNLLYCCQLMADKPIRVEWFGVRWFSESRHHKASWKLCWLRMWFHQSVAKMSFTITMNPSIELEFLLSYGAAYKCSCLFSYSQKSILISKLMPWQNKIEVLLALQNFQHDRNRNLASQHRECIPICVL